MRRVRSISLFVSVLTSLSGCGAVSQTPPTTSMADIEAWLKGGDYKSWHCEATPHTPREGSPHPSMDRVCSNNLVSAAGSGEYPVGSSSVVELYDSAGTTLVGHGVNLHVAAGKDPGTWFFYELVPANSTIMHDASGLVFLGLGNAGNANALCAGCHSSAGPPTYSGHDFVFTQVQ
jgi:hypothetical protein